MEMHDILTCEVSWLWRGALFSCVVLLSTEKLGHIVMELCHWLFCVTELVLLVLTMSHCSLSSRQMMMVPAVHGADLRRPTIFFFCMDEPQRELFITL